MCGSAQASCCVSLKERLRPRSDDWQMSYAKLRGIHAAMRALADSVQSSDSVLSREPVLENTLSNADPTYGQHRDHSDGREKRSGAHAGQTITMTMHFIAKRRPSEKKAFYQRA